MLEHPDFLKLPKLKDANCEPLAFAIVDFAFELEKNNVASVPILELLFRKIIEYGSNFQNRYDLVDGVSLKNRTLLLLKERDRGLYDRYVEYFESKK